MTLKTDIETAVKEAMKAKDNLRRNTLRLALSAIKQVEVDTRESVDDERILALLKKEVKSRRESISDAKKANRQDLIDAAAAEIEIFEEFLPQGLSEEEIVKIVESAISNVGASSMGDMGKVMPVVMSEIAGRADGGMVNQIVRNLLQNN